MMAESGRFEKACPDRRRHQIRHVHILHDRENTHGHADECIWDAGWSTERVAQQSIQIVYGVEQPSVHVQLERGQTVRLSRLVMQPVVDRGPTGESDQEPDACERGKIGGG